VTAAKITLREAQAIAYLLEHGRWPDAETAEWAESRVSKIALDYLLTARLKGTIAAHQFEADEEAGSRAHRRPGAF
jgi:DNA primase